MKDSLDVAETIFQEESDAVAKMSAWGVGPSLMALKDASGKDIFASTLVVASVFVCYNFCFF